MNIQTSQTCKVHVDRQMSSWMHSRTPMSLVPRESGLAGKWPDSKLPQHFEKLAQQLHDSDYRFWLNAIETVCLTSQCRFIDSFGLYIDAVIQQAADHDQSHIRSIQ